MIRVRPMPKTPDHLSEKFKYFTHFNVNEVIGGIKARYPACYAFTKQYEGGYVNDPHDPGGCTNMGITIGTLQAWRGGQVTCEDVKNLAEPEVGLIYSTNYWAPVWGNRLPIGLNLQVWDFGVNAGPSRAIKYLQRLTGSTQDGIMGPNSIDAVNNYVKEYGVSAAIRNYSALRQDYYESLSSFDRYGNGWTTRNEACCALGLQLDDQGTPTIPLPPIGDTELTARVASLENWAKSLAYK